MSIENLVMNIIQNVSDKKFKGIIKYKDKYIATDGFRLIIFKDNLENKNIIDKYFISSKIDMESLNIDYEKYKDVIKIDMDKLKKYIDHYDKTGIKLPYIEKNLNFNFGLDPLFVKEAIESTNSDSYYITNENLKPVIFKGELLDYILMPIKLDKDADKYEIPEMKNGEYCMKTAQEMYTFCIQNNLGSGWNEKWALKHFGIIEKSLMDDENVQIAFMGLHNYISPTKHDGNFAYAVTNKRILIAQQKVLGEIFQTISLDNINDITFTAGAVFGILTIDTIREKFNVGLDKVGAKNISNGVHKVLDNIKKNTKANDESINNSISVADEIKKFKELLDMGAISQEEYELKKKKLLDL